jgi:hypothetical protein
VRGRLQAGREATPEQPSADELWACVMTGANDANRRRRCVHCHHVPLSNDAHTASLPCASSEQAVMPPRIPWRAHRAACPPPAVRSRTRLQQRAASTSARTPDMYDVVCVGGGPAGLSLLAGLKASPVTSGLKVALIEGQDLHKNRLPADARPDSFSNRCSSLTPASVRNLQGKPSVSVPVAIADSWACRDRRMATRERRAHPALPGDAGVGRRV